MEILSLYLKVFFFKMFGKVKKKKFKNLNLFLKVGFDKNDCYVYFVNW